MLDQQVGVSANHHLHFDVKTKALIAGVGLGNLIGQVVTFLRGPARPWGSALKLPCEWAWTLLAFPLGWLGLVPAILFGGWTPISRIVLWAGVTMNAVLWAGVAFRIVRSLRETRHQGFDASAVILRLSHVRRTHVAGAHSRAKPLHARKGLIAIASQAISRCGYFARSAAQSHESIKQESPKQ